MFYKIFILIILITAYEKKSIVIELVKSLKTLLVLKRNVYHILIIFLTIKEGSPIKRLREFSLFTLGNCSLCFYQFAENLFEESFSLIPIAPS